MTVFDKTDPLCGKAQEINPTISVGAAGWLRAATSCSLDNTQCDACDAVRYSVL